MNIAAFYIYIHIIFLNYYLFLHNTLSYAFINVVLLSAVALVPGTVKQGLS